MVTIKNLLDLLAMHGGKIVSTASMEPVWIDQARASGRLYVDENSLGFVWDPPIDKLPENEKELEELEKWFPLQIELPDSLKDTSFLWKKRIDPKNN